MRAAGSRNTVISVAIVALFASSPGGAVSGSGGPTREALVTHGIKHFQERAMKQGLLELEEAVAVAPDWRPARRALAFALLRGGVFERAAEELIGILGTGLVGAIEAGEISGSRLPEGVDAEAVLGLAIVRSETEDYVAADRLYRSYADLVGPTAPAAAGAFWRLADVYETSEVEWGDPSAERAKALALDPDVALRIILPAFPDPASTPELEPYARPIEAASGREHPPDGYDSLPMLIRWKAPAGIDVASPSLFQRMAEAEILVDENGSVQEIVLPPEALEGNARGEAVAAAAAEWTFRPAVAEGAPVAAWISLSVDVPLGAAPDSLAPGEPPDTTAVDGTADRDDPDDAADAPTPGDAP